MKHQSRFTVRGVSCGIGDPKHGQYVVITPPRVGFELCTPAL